MNPPDSPHAVPTALSDPQGRAITYLRLSITDRCNYRCTYCMPEDGVEHAARADILSFEEIVALVDCFVALGVRRVRITGGEPTVRRDLVDLVRMLRAIAGLEELALSTNGERLSELAPALRAAGIDQLNVSLDTLSPERFARITRRGHLPAVLEGLQVARAQGFGAVKLNAVALKGFNDDEIGAIVRYAGDNGFVARFIEQMPMTDGALYVPGALMSAAEIRAAVAAAYPGHRLVAEGAARTAGPARYHRVVPEEAAAGTEGLRFGIISAMTEHFCDSCNRVRLSAAGALHSCLAHDDAVDLRGPLRRGGRDEVLATIRAAVAQKRDGHVFQISGRGGPRKSMIQIGG